MARSFYKPADLSNPIRYYHKLSDTWYSIEERGGSYYQRRWRIGYDGKRPRFRSRASITRWVRAIMSAPYLHPHRARRADRIAAGLVFGERRRMGDESGPRPRLCAAAARRRLRMHVLPQLLSEDSGGARRAGQRAALRRRASQKGSDASGATAMAQITCGLPDGRCKGRRIFAKPSSNPARLSAGPANGGVYAMPPRNYQPATAAFPAEVRARAVFVSAR